MHISDLVPSGCIELSASPADKQQALAMAVAMLEAGGVLSDAQRFARDVAAREERHTTGLGCAIALPHARSAGVIRPALAVLGMPDGLDFQAVDGQPVHLLFMIAAPEGASQQHLEVLAGLSALLADAELREHLMHCTTPASFVAALTQAEARQHAGTAETGHAPEQDHDERATDSRQDPGGTPASLTERGAAAAAQAKSTRYGCDVVAVTACPAGLSHTYLAAAALERAADELGITIKVEACGAAGTRNALTAADIARARAVIVAADREVDMERFAGKPLLRVGVAEGVHRPGRLLQRALHGEVPIYVPHQDRAQPPLPRRIYLHLMSGLTYILPLVLVAGLLAAFADLAPVRSAELGGLLSVISASVSSLILPILSAFIAFSIAGRTALTAGLSGGVMASVAASGVWGAVINGFIGGYLVQAMTALSQRVLRGHNALLALLLYPLFGAVFTALAAEFITAAPLAAFDGLIVRCLTEAALWELGCAGAVAGAMMAADMGGPCNKLAYALGVFLLADSFPNGMHASSVMAAVMIGGMVPPLVMSCAALAARRLFSAAERGLALRTALGGMLFITEQTLPYLQTRPYQMRAACMIGSAVGGACSMLAGVRVCAPHGGMLIAPLSNEPLGFMLALASGVVAGGLCAVLLRLHPSAAEA